MDFLLHRSISGLRAPDEGAARHFDNQIFARVTVHAFAHPGMTILGNQARLVILCDEIVQVVIGFENHVPAAAAVAAARAALGTILLALEGDTAFAAMTGPGVNSNLVNKHKKGEAGASPQNIGRMD